MTVSKCKWSGPIFNDKVFSTTLPTICINILEVQTLEAGEYKNVKIKQGIQKLILENSW